MTAVALGGDLSSALLRLPGVAGVARIVGAEDKTLLVGRASNLRKWAERHLGRGKPARKGARPPLDLSPVAREVVFETTTSDFHQRLTYERWMEPLVPRAKRRDLKPPVFLRLDPTERFARVTVEAGAPADPRGRFGPFRDRRAAEKAIAALHKLHPLRPCDFVFEPDPALPLGLGCVFAQVRSCSAPCLARVSEQQYRDLAIAAAERLSGGASDDWRPDWVAGAGVRAVVLEPGASGLEVYPVLAGAVLEENRVIAESEAAGLAAAVFTPPASPRDDWPWLGAWLAAPKRKGRYIVLRDGLAVVP
ncbi:MAG TPA: hypothetical protein VFM88_00830 [Vicinamibacteria bacterium]|nr:hypothetical protein [Vicinamibacteria bacterium]